MKKKMFQTLFLNPRGLLPMNMMQCEVNVYGSKVVYLRELERRGFSLHSLNILQFEQTRSILLTTTLTKTQKLQTPVVFPNKY